MPTNMENLGFDNWFQEKAEPMISAGHEIARVVAVNKDSFLIRNGEQDVFAEVSGKLMFNADSPLDYPTVGDWVAAQFFDDGAFAVIHDIVPRKSVLKRKTAGKKIDLQLIAANIDTAFIMQSFGYDYNIRRLERYLVMINESRIHPVALISKADLATPNEIEKNVSAIRELMPDLRIVAFSNKIDSDVDRIRELPVPGKTYCLLGSSGVGKTTLLNNLMDEERFETRAVREKSAKGKHTTTRRQLTILENGAMIIDTPGMRELGNFGVETGLEDTFAEIAQLAMQCRFNDCTHTNEKGCAILPALENGAISEARYHNYVKMNKESAYNEMSYLEKRQKDRQFGKYVKSVMKHKKDKR